MEFRVSLNNFRTSPRKVRLVADTIRGKSVKQAQGILEILNKKSATPIYGLLKSAIANAQNTQNVLSSQLKVSEIYVNGGAVLKRFRPRAFGRAYTIRKRTSHIVMTLSLLESVKKRESLKVKKDSSLSKKLDTKVTSKKSSKKVDKTDNTISK